MKEHLIFEMKEPWISIQARTFYSMYSLGGSAFVLELSLISSRQKVVRVVVGAVLAPPLRALLNLVVQPFLGREVNGLLLGVEHQLDGGHGVPGRGPPCEGVGPLFERLPVQAPALVGFHPRGHGRLGQVVDHHRAVRHRLGRVIQRSHLGRKEG